MPEHVLVTGEWAGDEGADLRVHVGVYDDRWVSAPCECTVTLLVDGTQVGQWDVRAGEFRDRGSSNRTWSTVIPDPDVGPCRPA